MDKQLHPKVDKILQTSRKINGRTLTGQQPDEIQVYGTNVNSNVSSKMVNPKDDQKFEKNYNT